MLNKLEQILFPSTCVLTGRVTEDIDLSVASLDLLERSDGICPVCAQVSLTNQVCGACLKNPPLIQHTQVAFVLNETMTQMISRFKYHEHLYFSSLLAELMLGEIDTTGVDYLLPVPLHLNRLSSRGFNQSLELAKQLSKHSGIPVWQGVERVLDTPHQVGLGGKERRQNLKNAFQLLGSGLEKGATLAIVDDVVTTGATMLEIAKVLHQSDASLSIQAWAVAKSAE